MLFVDFQNESRRGAHVLLVKKLPHFAALFRDLLLAQLFGRGLEVVAPLSGFAVHAPVPVRWFRLSGFGRDKRARR